MARDMKLIDSLYQHCIDYDFPLHEQQAHPDWPSIILLQRAITHGISNIDKHMISIPVRVLYTIDYNKMIFGKATPVFSMRVARRIASSRLMQLQGIHNSLSLFCPSCHNRRRLHHRCQHTV